MATPFDTRIASIAKESLTALLKPRGFRKRGSLYRYDLKELSWLIDVQKSRWNTQEAAEFTVNFGVFVPGVIATYGNRTEPDTPGIHHCCIYGRVGDLTPDHLDKWWKVNAHDALPGADQLISADIRQHVEQYILPFEEGFRTRRDVVEYLESGYAKQPVFWPSNEVIRFAYLGILYHLLGEQTKCRSMLERAANTKTKTALDDHIQELRDRLC
jgi:Domain of unknown function (DUF4304)